MPESQRDRSDGAWPKCEVMIERHSTRQAQRLACLAPEIVEAIAAGSQPPALTAETLAERVDLPLLWTATAQEKAAVLIACLDRPGSGQYGRTSRLIDLPKESETQ
jgi:hypothetical protein